MLPYVILGLVGAAVLWWFKRSKSFDGSPLIDAVRRSEDVSPYMKYAGRQNHLGRTALMFATIYNNIELIRQLAPIEAGIRNIHGATALMAAASQEYASRSSCHGACLQVLIEAGEACIQDRYGLTALMHAARARCTESVKTLIEAGEACIQDKYGLTALMRTAVNGDCDIMRILIAAGEACMRDNGGRTALMYAARARCTESVKMLIAAGEARMRDNFGRTALMYAIRAGYAESAKMLIAAGEDPYMVDPETHQMPAERLGLKRTQPATLQMQCLRHIRYDGRPIGLWHPDLPPALRECFCQN